jgi:hypothetical protein
VITHMFAETRLGISEPPYLVLKGQLRPEDLGGR